MKLNLCYGSFVVLWNDSDAVTWDNVFLEAPARLVHVKAQCENGKANSFGIQNVPSFVDKLDLKLGGVGLGTLTVDTAYGGDSFVLVDAKSMGFEIVPDEGRELSDTGVMIAVAANEKIKF